MSLTPGLNLPFGIQPINPVPVDSWSGPYSAATEIAAVALANSAITSTIRFVTMEVRIIFSGIAKKYWYRDGIADINLVEFASGSGGNFLSISGGTVTGDTIFTQNVSANTIILTTTNATSPLNFPIFITNPASPNDGDVWILSGATGNALFNIRLGGETKTVELT